MFEKYQIVDPAKDTLISGWYICDFGTESVFLQYDESTKSFIVPVFKGYKASINVVPKSCIYIGAYRYQYEVFKSLITELKMREEAFKKNKNAGYLNGYETGRDKATVDKFVSTNELLTYDQFNSLLQLYDEYTDFALSNRVFIRRADYDTEEEFVEARDKAAYKLYLEFMDKRNNDSTGIK